MYTPENSSTKPQWEEFFSDTCCSVVEALLDHHQTAKNTKLWPLSHLGTNILLFWGLCGSAHNKNSNAMLDDSNNPAPCMESFKMWHAATVAGRWTQKKHWSMVQPSG